jgi:hypothetical protein
VNGQLAHRSAKAPEMQDATLGTLPLLHATNRALRSTGILGQALPTPGSSGWGAMKGFTQPLLPESLRRVAR